MKPTKRQDISIGKYYISYGRDVYTTIYLFKCSKDRCTDVLFNLWWNERSDREYKVNEMEEVYRGMAVDTTKYTREYFELTEEEFNRHVVMEQL